MESDRLIRIYGTSLIEKDGKILLQQERNELSYGKWYFPSGRMEPKESILDCVRRETFEETGYKVKPKYLIGIYQYDFMKKDQLVENVNFVFRSEIIGGRSKVSDSVLDIQWIEIDKILEMTRTDKARNHKFMQAAINDFQNSKQFPLDLIKLVDK